MMYSIVNIIKKIFCKKDQNIKMIEDKQQSNETMLVNDEKEIEQTISKQYNYEDEKKDFFKLYNEAKKDDFDVFSLNKEELAKICDMMEEEIKIEQRYIDELKKKIANKTFA